MISRTQKDPYIMNLKPLNTCIVCVLAGQGLTYTVVSNSQTLPPHFVISPASSFNHTLSYYTNSVENPNLLFGPTLIRPSLRSSSRPRLLSTSGNSTAGLDPCNELIHSQGILVQPSGSSQLLSGLIAWPWVS